MPRVSAHYLQERREEIIAACARLYETMSFKDITIKEIGKATSFTRTSIYNYFRTKEEIFLALMQREYEAWTADLNALADSTPSLTRDGLAQAMARSLEKRKRLLKLLSMNHFDMEENSRYENLTAFKFAYGNSIKAVDRCRAKRILVCLLSFPLWDLSLRRGHGRTAAGHGGRAGRLSGTYCL